MISGEPPPDISTALKQRHFAFLPSLMSPATAYRLEQKTRNLSSRRVSVGDNSATWDEQTLAPDHEVVTMFSSAQVIDFITSATRHDIRVIDLVCWIARYKNGEYIDRHKDNAGTLQLLVCLAAPPSENGGALVLAPGPNEHRYVLRAGDGVLFSATTVEHCTTPLKPSVTYPDPIRVVAVARYFLVGHTSTPL
ncbi:MAG: 2OG-Fe(II) oxygenase [Pseudonocardiales bacterium]|nr:2OG-Fe(II) oxygenase [Pseudonocardiales bacterium]